MDEPEKKTPAPKKDDPTAESQTANADRTGGSDGGDDGGGDVRPVGKLAAMDAMMAEHVWHPRFIPFLAYLLLLTLTGFISDALPWSYPILYVIQCGTVVWLLWRYRKLLPELTLSFHWLAVPVGLGVAYAWIWIGMVVEESQQVGHDGIAKFTANLNQFMLTPDTAAEVAGPNGETFYFIDHGNATQDKFEQMAAISPAIFWAAFSLRLLGMSLVVPLFEELFIRSLILRSMSSAKQTGVGMLQVLQDFPVIGDWLMNTKAGQNADEQPPMFTKQFNETRLGKLTIFGVVASTLIFAVNHVPRDYLGCVMCGVAYCLLLAATWKKGLGPVCWAHGITNAALWLYTLHTDDWRFL